MFFNRSRPLLNAAEAAAKRAAGQVSAGPQSPDHSPAPSDDSAGSTTPTTPTSPTAAGPLGGLFRTQARPISTVALPTIVKTRKDGSARIDAPGHVQIRPSATEQKLYGLRESYGHHPEPGVRGTARRTEVTLYTGQTAVIVGVEKPGGRFGDDKPIPLSCETAIVVDHGPLSPEQAKILKQLGEQPILERYETTGQLGCNCVSGHKEVMKKVLGVDIPTHTFMTPQEMAEAVKDVRTSGEPPGPEGPSGTSGTSGAPGADADAASPPAEPAAWIARAFEVVHALLDQGRPHDAGAQAALMLEPALLRDMVRPWGRDSTTVGVKESAALHAANVSYMRGLATLTTSGVLAAKQVFTRLGVEPAGEQAVPYLLQIAWRIHRRPSASETMAHSVAGLLVSIAEQGGRGDKAFLPWMRAALLQPPNAKPQSKTGADKYHRDFYSTLISFENYTADRSSLILARGLKAAGLVLEPEELKRAGVSSARRSKINAVFEKAKKDDAKIDAAPAPATLREVVQRLAMVRMADARAADTAERAELGVWVRERQRREEAMQALRAAVDDVVARQWDAMSRAMRRKIGGDMSLSPREGVGSVPTHAPSELGRKAFETLVDSARGKEMVARLLEAGGKISAADEPAFAADIAGVARGHVGAWLGESAQVIHDKVSARRNARRQEEAMYAAQAAQRDAMVAADATARVLRNAWQGGAQASGTLPAFTASASVVHAGGPAPAFAGSAPIVHASDTPPAFVGSVPVVPASGAREAAPALEPPPISAAPPVLEAWRHQVSSNQQDWTNI